MPASENPPVAHLRPSPSLPTRLQTEPRRYREAKRPGQGQSLAQGVVASPQSRLALSSCSLPLAQGGSGRPPHPAPGGTNAMLHGQKGPSSLNGMNLSVRTDPAHTGS